MLRTIPCVFGTIRSHGAVAVGTALRTPRNNNIHDFAQQPASISYVYGVDTWFKIDNFGGDVIRTQAITGEQVEIPVRDLFSQSDEQFTAKAQADSNDQLTLVDVSPPQVNKNAWNPTCALCGKVIPNGMATEGDTCPDKTYGGFHQIFGINPEIKGVWCEAAGIVKDDTMFSAHGHYFCDDIFQRMLNWDTGTVDIELPE